MKKASENTLQSYRRDIVYYGKYLETNQINFAKTQEDDIKKCEDIIALMNKILDFLERIKKIHNIL